MGAVLDKIKMLEKFTDLMTAHKDDKYYLCLDGWQIGILHSLLALAANHPGVQKLGKPTQTTIREARGWCKDVFRRWGFTQEEADWLDKMRDNEQPTVQ